MGLSLSACLLIPNQLPDPEPFDEDRITFVEVGASTRQEVASAMFEFPVQIDSEEVTLSLLPRTFRGGTTWLYALRREEFHGVDGGFLGHDYRFLRFDFDSNGVVRSVETLKSEWGCSRDGVCVRETAAHDLKYWLLATDAEDRAVKLRDLASDMCGVYLFGRTGSNGTIAIELDGQLVGEIMDRNHYFFVATGRGGHRLSLQREFYYWDHVASGKRPTLHEFECVGQEVFFSLRPRRGEVILAEIDESSGRTALATRRLTLSED